MFFLVTSPLLHSILSDHLSPINRQILSRDFAGVCTFLNDTTHLVTLRSGYLDDYYYEPPISFIAHTLVQCVFLGLEEPFLQFLREGIAEDNSSPSTYHTLLTRLIKIAPEDSLACSFFISVNLAGVITHVLLELSSKNTFQMISNQLCTGLTAIWKRDGDFKEELSLSHVHQFTVVGTNVILVLFQALFFVEEEPGERKSIFSGDILVQIGSLPTQDETRISKPVFGRDNFHAVFHTSGLSNQLLSTVKNDHNNEKALADTVDTDTLDNPYSHTRFLNLITSEFMACCISGARPGVYNHILSRLMLCSSPRAIHRPEHSKIRQTQKSLIEISEITDQCPDPVKRLRAIFRFFEHANDDSLRESLQWHTAHFLHAHPDIVPQLLSVNPFLDWIVHRDDSVPCLVFLMSAFAVGPNLVVPRVFLGKHSPVNSDPGDVYPLQYETAMTNFLFRVAELSPSLLPDIHSSGNTFIYKFTARLAINTARVVSSDPNEPRCLCFGRDNQKWIAFLAAQKELMKPRKYPLWLLSVSCISLIVLLAASIDDGVSEAAILFLSSKSQLTVEQTRALLFSTPTTFPISSDWPLPVYNQHNPSQNPPPSLCAEAGRLLSERRDKPVKLEPQYKHPISEEIATLFGSCVLYALHSNSPLTSSRVPFFAEELWNDDERQRIWSNATNPKTGDHLHTFSFASIPCPSRRNLKERPNWSAIEFSSAWLFILHNFPFVVGETTWSHLSGFQSEIDSYILRPEEQQQFWKIVMDVLMSRSLNTPLDSFRELHWVLSRSSQHRRISWRMDEELTIQPTILRAKLKTAEGDEKWNVFARLWVLSQVSEEETDEMVMLAETDEQLLLALSSPLHNDQPFEYQPAVVICERNVSRVLKAAGRTDNLELAGTAWNTIRNGILMDRIQLFRKDEQGKQEANKEMSDLFEKVLHDMCAVQRKDVPKGSIAKVDPSSSSLLRSCLIVLRSCLQFSTLDPSPFLPVLASLALTADLPLLLDLLLVFREIGAQTKDSSKPFTLSSFIIPFSPHASAPSQPHSLLYIVSSIVIAEDNHSSEDTSKVVECFDYSHDAKLELIKTSLHVSVDQLNAAKLSSSPKRPPFTSSFLSTTEQTPETTLLIIWRNLRQILFTEDKTSLFEQHFTRFLPSLLRLVPLTIALSSDHDDDIWIGFLYLPSLHSSILPLLEIIKPLDQHEWDANPSISTLVSQLAFLLMYFDPSIPSSSGSWNPSKLVPLLKPGKPFSVFASNASDFTTQKWDGTRQLLTRFKEEGLEDRCEQFDLQTLHKPSTQTMSTLRILGSNSWMLQPYFNF
ncbi:hypothetical protein BLNAU_21314 [Blattamonas nauphoetae]|uniref:Uncharacterized protein n=1 Tax=Blattamonas nauphoetae TaxID=2049346 RepID=A0ABQ9WW92_9EUKA|nr:hypothetical protein BLNAU_21314 [Blattamonas nauphoetae]